MTEESKAAAKTVRSLAQGINKQRGENTAAIKKMGTSVRQLQNKVKEFQGEIQEQARITAIAVKELNVGTKKVISGIKEKRAQMDAYIKNDFYG